MPLHSAETLGQGLSFMSEVAHGLQLCKEEGDLAQQIADPWLNYWLMVCARCLNSDMGSACLNSYLRMPKSFWLSCETNVRLQLLRLRQESLRHFSPRMWPRLSSRPRRSRSQAKQPWKLMMLTLQRFWLLILTSQLLRVTHNISTISKTTTLHCGLRASVLTLMVPSPPQNRKVIPKSWAPMSRVSAWPVPLRPTKPRQVLSGNLYKTCICEAITDKL